MIKEVLLMRFRDFSEKDSIEDHKIIINKNNYTWAGWWARTMEQVPLKKIKELKAVANTSSLDLFLFNYVKNTIYLASVIDIAFGVNPKELIPSPEPQFTPDYYNADDLQVWFKIESIEICSPAIIESYSYQDYDLFPVHNDKSFSAYDDKLVESLDKLAVQERTLILLRSKKNTDKSIDSINEVRRIPKKCFSDGFELTDSNSILLCSDLHFSTDDKNFAFDDFNNEPTVHKKKLAGAVKRLVRKEQFSSLICPGDFTFKACSEEFKKATDFVVSVSNNHGIEKQNIVIVPGNHDMKFSEKPNNKKITYNGEEAKKEYINFFKSIYGITPNEHLAIGKKILLKNRLPIEIVGLNSNCLQQEKGHFVGMGFVGDNQLDMVAEGMGWENNLDKTYAYRILVLHHNLYPVELVQEPKKNHFYSLCLDAGAIVEFINKYKINLVIHGHKHKNYFMQAGGMTDENPSHFNIFSLGSASSTDLGGGTNNCNCIGVLDFNEYGYLKIKTYAIDNQSDVNSKNCLFERKIPLWD